MNSLRYCYCGKIFNNHSALIEHVESCETIKKISNYFETLLNIKDFYHRTKICLCETEFKKDERFAFIEHNKACLVVQQAAHYLDNLNGCLSETYTELCYCGMRNMEEGFCMCGHYNGCAQCNGCQTCRPDIFGEWELKKE